MSNIAEQFMKNMSTNICRSNGSLGLIYSNSQEQNVLLIVNCELLRIRGLVQTIFVKNNVILTLYFDPLPPPP